MLSRWTSLRTCRWSQGLRVCGRPRRRDVLGLILVKELILWDHSTRTEVGVLKMRSMPLLRADTRLYDMLRLFETCRCHMALLVRRSAPRPWCCVMLEHASVTLHFGTFWLRCVACSTCSTTKHSRISCTAVLGHSRL